MMKCILVVHWVTIKISNDKIVSFFLSKATSQEMHHINTQAHRKVIFNTKHNFTLFASMVFTVSIYSVTFLSNRSDFLQEAQDQVSQCRAQRLIVVAHNVCAVLFQLNQCVLRLQVKDVSLCRLLHFDLHDAMLQSGCAQLNFVLLNILSSPVSVVPKTFCSSLPKFARIGSSLPNEGKFLWNWIKFLYCDENNLKYGIWLQYRKWWLYLELNSCKKFFVFFLK